MWGGGGAAGQAHSPGCPAHSRLRVAASLAGWSSWGAPPAAPLLLPADPARPPPPAQRQAVCCLPVIALNMPTKMAAENSRPITFCRRSQGGHGTGGARLSGGECGRAGRHPSVPRDLRIIRPASRSPSAGVGPTACLDVCNAGGLLVAALHLALPQKRDACAGWVVGGRSGCKAVQTPRAAGARFLGVLPGQQQRREMARSGGAGHTRRQRSRQVGPPLPASP